jgi:hypothetical protein
MGKLVRNLIIGILIAIFASFVVRGFSKFSAENAYNTYLQNGQQDYEIVQAQTGSNSLGASFTNNEPHFTLTPPIGLSLEKAIDRNGVIAYKGENDTIMCQLQVIDIYTLTNLEEKNVVRRMLDYNMYSKESMDAAYDGLVKSTVANSPYGEIINVEHSVQKINNVVFIYIKYEMPDEDGNMTRKSYNFLVNGYTVSVVGFYFKSDIVAEVEVDKFLKSIKF